MHLDLSDILQIVMFVISLSVFFQRSMPFYLKLFPFYFFYEFAISMVLGFTQRQGMHNAWIANSSGILEFCFDVFVLKSFIKNMRAKWVISILTIVFALFAFANILIFQKKVGFNSINFTVGCLLLVVLCIYYFAELFQKSDAESLSTLPSFWISSAILFNTVLIFPIFALLSFMQGSTRFNTTTTELVFTHIEAIYNIISVLTYILYSIAFLCRIRIRRSTL